MNILKYSVIASQLFFTKKTKPKTTPLITQLVKDVFLPPLSYTHLMPFINENAVINKHSSFHFSVTVGSVPLYFNFPGTVGRRKVL